MKQTFDKVNGIQLPVSEPNEFGVFRNTEDFAYETPEYSVQVGLVRCEDGYRTSISINQLKGDYHGLSSLHTSKTQHIQMQGQPYSKPLRSTSAKAFLSWRKHSRRYVRRLYVFNSHYFNYD